MTGTLSLHFVGTFVLAFVSGLLSFTHGRKMSFIYGKDANIKMCDIILVVKITIFK